MAPAAGLKNCAVNFKPKTMGCPAKAMAFGRTSLSDNPKACESDVYIYIHGHTYTHIYIIFISLHYFVQDDFSWKVAVPCSFDVFLNLALSSFVDRFTIH